MDKILTKAGFVATLGRPNAGKSSLLNALLGENIALTSHKANATRKQLQVIVPYAPLNAQIVFVDTPGLHHKERLLNQYMLSQAIKAMGDCDLAIYLAQINDEISHYERFLELCQNKAHILFLTKTDLYSNEQILLDIARYKPFEKMFLALMPVSVKKGFKRDEILHLIASHLPNAPFFYDENLLSSTSQKDICKEMIRESLFKHLSEEIPYESDVIIKTYKQRAKNTLIVADIIVEKPSQKAMIIGKQGSTIKRVGIYARNRISAFNKNDVFLQLKVEVCKGWSKKQDMLKKIGYDVAL